MNISKNQQRFEKAYYMKEREKNKKQNIKMNPEKKEFRERHPHAKKL